MKYTKIEKIEKTSPMDIYHLTVKNNHNFFGNNLCLHNCGYRGEIQFTFNKTQGVHSHSYNVGDRIGQILILPYPQINFVEADILGDSVRGNGGFGHTGN
jgi:dUTPase